MHRQRQRVLRADQRSDTDRVAVRDEVLEVLLDREADDDDGREPAPDREQARQSGAMSRARHAERGGVAPQACAGGQNCQGSQRRQLHQHEAGGAPVVVAGAAQRRGEPLSRTDLGEEDRVMADEQATPQAPRRRSVRALRRQIGHVTHTVRDTDCPSLPAGQATAPSLIQADSP